MVGYHATIISNGESILRTEQINVSDREKTLYGLGAGLFDTTSGFVYLATSAEKALDFGILAWSKKLSQNEQIQLQILDTEILIDQDEAELEDVGWDLHDNEEIIKLTQSFCVKRPLILGMDVTSYAILKYNSVNDAWKKVD